MVVSVARASRIASGMTPRSSRSRIRSAALIATSVPVPRARPRSAAASAGPSLTPSPAMATRRPRACRSWITATLSPGSAPAITSSAPIWAATVSATAWLSPVSSTVRRPRPRSAATAAAAEGLTVSATATAPRAWPPHPASTTVRPARSHAAHGPARTSGMVIPRSANSLSRPAITSWPSMIPRAPRPGRARKPSARGRSPSSARAEALIAAATGCSEASSTPPRRRMSSWRLVPGPGCTAATAISPVVRVPVLSSTIVSTDREASSAG
jgi:hypothetical protein